MLFLLSIKNSPTADHTVSRGHVSALSPCIVASGCEPCQRHERTNPAHDHQPHHEHRGGHHVHRGHLTKQFCETFVVSRQRSADACSCFGSVVSLQWAPMPLHAVCRCCPQTHPFRPWIPSCTRTAHPSRPFPPAHERGREWKFERTISAGQPEANADCNSMLVIRRGHLLHEVSAHESGRGLRT